MNTPVELALRRVPGLTRNTIGVSGNNASRFFSTNVRQASLIAMTRSNRRPWYLRTRNSRNAT